MTKEEFEYYVDDLNNFIVGTFKLDSAQGYHVELRHIDGFLSWRLEDFTFDIIIELIESDHILYNPERYTTWKTRELRIIKLKELGL